MNSVFMTDRYKEILIAGEIFVYPVCKGLKLTELEKLRDKMSEVAECINEGLCTKQAEKNLLEMYKNA